MKIQSLKMTLPAITGYFRTGPKWPEWGRQLEFDWDQCELFRVGHLGVFKGILKAPILSMPMIEAQWLPETLRLKSQWWKEEGRFMSRGFRVTQETPWGSEKGFQKVSFQDIKVGCMLEECAPVGGDDVNPGRLRLDMELAYLTQQQERVNIRWSHHWNVGELEEGMAQPGALEDDGFS